jgi:hypothetical protein
MATATAKLPPPPKANGAPKGAAPKADRPFAVTSGLVSGPQRIVLYGPGGIGKSTLSGQAPGAVVIDLESGTREIDLQRIEGIETFSELRACLRSDALEGFGTVVLDTATKVEELAVAHTLASVLHDKGHHVDNLEGYGFGKGYMYVYDTFMLLLQDVDYNVRQGRNVILVAHECVDNVPNPTGDDWIRFEPQLQSPRSGKASIRNRVIQWADHVLFVGYDVVTSDGKGKGGGTRTIYPAERPTHRAKSRTLPPDPLVFQNAADTSIWQLIFGGGQ